MTLEPNDPTAAADHPPSATPPPPAGALPHPSHRGEPRKDMTLSSDAVRKLALLSIAATVQQAVRGYAGAIHQPDLGILLWRLGMPLLLIAWLREDFRRSRYWPCFEYDTFVFWAWPVVFPYYLFHTRGVRGVRAFLGFLALIMMPTIAMALAYVLFHGPFHQVAAP